jgi:hypothetical protein
MESTFLRLVFETVRVMKFNDDSKKFFLHFLRNANNTLFSLINSATSTLPLIYCLQNITMKFHNEQAVG